MRRTTAIAAATLAVAAFGGLIRPADASTASPWTDHQMTASASGVRVRTVVPGSPASAELIGWASPWTDAVHDSLGASNGRAAFAYPGAAFISAIGVPKNAIDGSPAGPMPPELASRAELPLVAQSSHPTAPAATNDAGPVHLASQSTGSGTATVAEVGDAGGGSGTAVSHAGVVAGSDGVLAARAGATVESIAIGDFSATRVASMARIRRTAGGQPEVDVALVVVGARFGGTPVGLGPGAVLESSTTTVRYVEASRSDTHATAPAIEVTTHVPASMRSEPSQVITTIAEASVKLEAAPGRTLTRSPTAREEPPTVAAPGDPGARRTLPRGTSSPEVPGAPAHSSDGDLPGATPIPVVHQGAVTPPSPLAAPRAEPPASAPGTRWYLPVFVGAAAMVSGLAALRHARLRRFTP